MGVFLRAFSQAWRMHEGQVLPEGWQAAEEGNEGEQRHRDGEAGDCASEGHGDGCNVLRPSDRVDRCQATPRERVSERVGSPASTSRSTAPPQLIAMPAPTVYDKVADNVDLHGQLFAGKKFFVAQRVPFRNTYLNMIRNNGGELVLLEKKADYLIFDHIRHDCPPGSISYTFIEKSIEEGELQDPEKHRIGPPAGTAREAGALAQPTKSGRAAYTAEEDRILYKWVRDAERQGKLASGNQIYKELEAKVRACCAAWRLIY